jgi:hypothetical protein
MEALMTKADPGMASRPQLRFEFRNGYVASLIVRDLGDAMLAYWPLGHTEMIEHVGTELSDDEVASALDVIKRKPPHFAGKMAQAAKPVTSRPKPKRKTHRLRLAYDPANP